MQVLLVTASTQTKGFLMSQCRMDLKLHFLNLLSRCKWTDISQTGKWIFNCVGPDEVPNWNRIPNLHSVSIYFGERTENYVSSDTLSKKKKKVLSRTGWLNGYTCDLYSTDNKFESTPWYGAISLRCSRYSSVFIKQHHLLYINSNSIHTYHT